MQQDDLVHLIRTHAAARAPRTATVELRGDSSNAPPNVLMAVRQLDG
jgi:hypothetical protein